MTTTMLPNNTSLTSTSDVLSSAHSVALSSTTTTGLSEGAIIGILCGIAAVMVIIIIVLLIYLYVIPNQRSNDQLVAEEIDLDGYDNAAFHEGNLPSKASQHEHIHNETEHEGGYSYRKYHNESDDNCVDMGSREEKHVTKLQTEVVSLHPGIDASVELEAHSLEIVGNSEC